MGEASVHMKRPGWYTSASQKVLNWHKRWLCLLDCAPDLTTQSKYVHSNVPQMLSILMGGQLSDSQIFLDQRSTQWNGSLYPSSHLIPHYMCSKATPSHHHGVNFAVSQLPISHISNKILEHSICIDHPHVYVTLELRKLSVWKQASWLSFPFSLFQQEPKLTKLAKPTECQIENTQMVWFPLFKFC